MRSYVWLSPQTQDFWSLQGILVVQSRQGEHSLWQTKVWTSLSFLLRCHLFHKDSLLVVMKTWGFLMALFSACCTFKVQDKMPITARCRVLDACHCPYSMLLRNDEPDLKATPKAYKYSLGVLVLFPEIPDKVPTSSAVCDSQFERQHISRLAIHLVVFHSHWPIHRHPHVCGNSLSICAGSL